MKQQPVVNPSVLLHRQAVEHFRQGRMAQGIEVMRKALELNPGSGEMHSHLAIALYQTGNMTEAGKHFEKSIRLSPRDPVLLNDFGIFLLESDKPEEAERLLRKALEVKSGYPEALLNLGHSVERRGRYGEAEQYYSRALSINPKFAEAFFALGSLCLKLKLESDHDRAPDFLKKGLTLNPKYENGWLHLIRFYEVKHNTAMEKETLAKAQRYLPHSAKLKIVRASLLRREGKLENLPELLDEAAKAMTAAIPSVDAYYELGKSYDAVGDAANAFRWFKAANDAEKKSYIFRTIRTEAFPEKIDGYRRALTDYAAWPAAPPLPPDAVCPVFLVGFPRSGTTLLDQMFSSHPSIEVAEEKPAVQTAESALEKGKQQRLWEFIARIDENQIFVARESYFSTMRKYGCALKPGGVFIDKLPLNMIQAPLIRRIFPEARFILALRHPCDSVLSNFMQRFAPNGAMVHMLDLADAAKFYDRVFSAWEDSRSVMNLSVHTIKYENVVTDMKAEIISALEFLGLDWVDSIARYDETAKARWINTPSRSQVTQKLYTRAKGRWHKYKDFMEDVPEMLRPWAEKFGYEME